MKLKYIAAAAASMIAAAPAFADIGGPTLPGAEVFLTVWSQTGTSGGTANVSYTFDTGVTLLAMMANKGTNLFINEVVSGNSAWDTLLSTSGGNGLQFAVTAAAQGQQGDVAKDTMLSTFAGNPYARGVNNTLLSLNLTAVDVFLGAVNGTGTHGGVGDTSVNGYSVNTAGDAYFMTNESNTWSRNASNNSVAVGTNAVFGSIVGNGAAAGNLVNINTATYGTFGVVQSGSSYSLQYQVAAVPEPTGYALALAGFGVIGFVGRRRRQS